MSPRSAWLLYQLRWNPHFHSLLVEGGFDEQGAFVSVPFSGLQAMTEVFRRRVIWLLVEKELLSEEFALNLLSWRNSGFSIDNSVRLTDARSQESLAQYISRPQGWRASHPHQGSRADDPGFEPLDDCEDVTVDARKRAWARLLAKVHEGCAPRSIPWSVPSAV